MNIFDKTYQAIDLTNTTTAEAIGIVYAAITCIDERHAEDADDFLNAVEAFEDVSIAKIDRVPEDEYNDNIHRSDGSYCVRLMLTDWDNYDIYDNHPKYMISISTDQDNPEPNLRVCFQRVNEKSEQGHIERVFKTIANVPLGRDTIDYLLTDK